MLAYRYWAELKKSHNLRDFRILMDFASNYPSTEREYQARAKREQEQRNKIMGIQNREKRIDTIKNHLGLFGIDPAESLRR